MDYNEIKRSCFILGVGFLFLSLYSFATLYQIPGLEAAINVRYAMYVGMTLLVVGSSLMKREHKYFRASFTFYLFLAASMITYFILGKYAAYNELENDATFVVVFKIFETVNNVLIVLCNTLINYGLKEAYIKKKKKKMITYCTAMEFVICGLTLMSTVLNLINFTGDLGITIGSSFIVAFDFLTSASYCLFMFISCIALR